MGAPYPAHGLSDRPHARARIEISMIRLSIALAMTALTRGRELKYGYFLHFIFLLHDRPHARARIEMFSSHQRRQSASDRPHARARIEIIITRF